MTNVRQAIKQIPGALPAYRGARRMVAFAAGLVGYSPPKASSSRKYWDRRAREMWDYDRRSADDEVYRQAIVEAIAELRGLPWRSLLEVGCGFGRVLGGLRAAFPDRLVVGGDFSHQQLQRGREFLAEQRVGLAQFDMRRLPFGDRRFDVVLTMGTLIYAPPEELPAVLEELRRVGRRYLVLVEYAREHVDSPTRRRLMDQAPWYGHDYAAALRRAGIPVGKTYPLRAWADRPRQVPQSLTVGTLGN